jgi:hypothetical protein
MAPGSLNFKNPLFIIPANSYVVGSSSINLVFAVRHISNPSPKGQSENDVVELMRNNPMGCNAIILQIIVNCHLVRHKSNLWNMT